MSANLKLEQGIIIPNQGRIRGGRSLDGGVFFDITFPTAVQPGESRRMNFAPREAFQLAAGVMRALGIEVEYTYDGPGEAA